MNIKEFKLKFIQFKFKALKSLLGLLVISCLITFFEVLKGNMDLSVFIACLVVTVLLTAEQIYLHGSPDNWGKSMSKN
ncbi:hypothetical protein [Clostridium baratii]|uniref:hypothetical protein n=1 Tax=Clostridium baratii TaxID=1561 RepID=UPI0030D0B51C